MFIITFSLLKLLRRKFILRKTPMMVWAFYVDKKTRRITPGKPQAATQAKYAIVPPAPYLPVRANFRARRFWQLQFWIKHPRERRVNKSVAEEKKEIRAFGFCWLRNRREYGSQQLIVLKTDRGKRNINTIADNQNKGYRRQQRIFKGRFEWCWLVRFQIF